MIAITMKCDDCRKEILEKMSNEDYSQYLQKRKQSEKQGVEYGWFCNDCVHKKCVMCRKEKVTKFIPAKEGDEIRKKIPTCQSCFDRFRETLGITEEIEPESLNHLENLTHEEWTEFLKQFKK